ncbi:MAG: hypothetical protein K6G68_08565 [Oscillospiraceae bacterium]|nr:hypothetical protein [Oscillospiraceae bacterium]
MTDTEQAAYDAAEKNIVKLHDDREYYKRLASYWRDIAKRLMDIEELHTYLTENAAE